VSDVDTRWSGRHRNYCGASSIAGERSSSDGDNHAIEDPSARGVTAHDKGAPLKLDITQSNVAQDFVDLRAQLILELVLRLLGLVPGLRKLDVVRVAGSGDCHVGTGNGCDFLARKCRRRMTGMRLLRAGARGADNEDHERTPP
jgi:hypothetical protein